MQKTIVDGFVVVVAVMMMMTTIMVDCFVVASVVGREVRCLDLLDPTF